jgi:hypothetical protein
MTDAPATFNEQAADYDAPRRRLIPPFDAFYGTGGRPERLLRRPLSPLARARVQGARRDAAGVGRRGGPHAPRSCASVEAQLAWLRDAGFADADCLFQDHRFAVLVGRA